MAVEKIYLKTFEREDAVVIPSKFAQIQDVKLFREKLDDGTEQYVFDGGWILIPKEYFDTYGNKIKKGDNKTQGEVLKGGNFIGFNVYIKDDNKPELPPTNLDINCYRDDIGVAGEVDYQTFVGKDNKFCFKSMNSEGDMLIMFAPQGDFKKMEGTLIDLRDKHNIPVDFESI